MARSVSTGRPIAEDARQQLPFPQVPGLAPQPVTFFAGAKGLDTTTKISRLDKAYCPVLRNYLLDRGRLAQRASATLFGSVAASTVMLVVDFVSSTGVRFPLRFTQTGLDKYDPGVQDWVNVPSVVLTGGPTDFFSVTIFGKKLLFSNGVDGIYEYDPQAGSVTKITTSVHVPSARSLATFNGRVIAANVTDDTGLHTGRVRWTAKNIETKWDEVNDLGAGVEDQQPSAGLEAEACRGVFPITESVALLVMSNSIRLMSETDVLDVPFKFSYLLPGFGTDSPYSLALIPGGGVIGFFRDNFYVVSIQSPVAIGDKIIDALLPQILDPGEIAGTYDPIRQEYRVVVKETGAVWRYSFREKGWTNDVYPWTPKSLSLTKYDKTALTIDQLPGTIDSLVGAIDDLGLFQKVNGVYLPHGTRVAREDPAATLDDQAGTDNTEVRTGLILPASPLQTIEIVEIQLEYETLQGTTVTFDWSSDGGTTWNNIGSYAIVPTQGPDILSVRKAISAKQLQIRMTTVTPVAPTIIALHAFAMPGGLRKP